MTGVIKLLALLLSVCMLLPLASCNRDGVGEGESVHESESAHKSETESESESESEGGEQTQPLEEPLLLVDNGVPLYAIVYEDADYETAATNMQSILKTKTGLDFSCLKFIKEDIGSIVIGAKPNDLGEAGASITGNGYGVIKKDGNIFICGYTVQNVFKAANDFLSAIIPSEHVIKGDNGRTQRVIVPEQSFFITNPDYFVKDPKLLSADLSQYRLVTHDENDSAEFELGDMLLNVVLAKTGVIMKHVSDNTDAREYEIIFGDTARPESAAIKAELAPDEYAIKSVGKSLYIVLGSYVCFTDAANAFHALYADGAADTISVKGKAANSYGLEKSSADLVRIMSFNVLVETYDILAVSAKNRPYIHTDCVLAYMPDAVGFQETSSFIRGIFENELSAYYDMVEVVDGTSKDYIYYPIFYRKDLYRVVDSSYRSYDNNGADMWGYVWALLESKTDPSRQFVIVNTHFPIQDDRGQDDWAVCNAELKRIQRLYPEIPMFLTGDFNATLGSSRHEAVYGGLTNALDGSERLTQDAGTGSASVDMVLVTRDLVTVDRYRVLRYDVVQHSSDHAPVFADIDISKKE